MLTNLAGSKKQKHKMWLPQACIHTQINVWIHEQINFTPVGKQDKEYLLLATLRYGNDLPCLSSLRLWVNYRSKWGWRRRHCASQVGHTLSCTEEPVDWMIKSGNTLKVINSGITQPCRSNFHPIPGIMRFRVGCYKWRRMGRWSNILLLLRGSPLASVSTQLCSGPSIQKKTTMGKTMRETAEKVRQDGKQRSKQSKGLCDLSERWKTVRKLEFLSICSSVAQWK